MRPAPPPGALSISPIVRAMPHEVGETSILEPLGTLANRGDGWPRVCAKGESLPESTKRNPQGALTEDKVPVVVLYARYVNYGNQDFECWLLRRLSCSVNIDENLLKPVWRFLDKM